MGWAVLLYKNERYSFQASCPYKLSSCNPSIKRKPLPSWIDKQAGIASNTGKQGDTLRGRKPPHGHDQVKDHKPPSSCSCEAVFFITLRNNRVQKRSEQAPKWKYKHWAIQRSSFQSPPLLLCALCGDTTPQPLLVYTSA